MKSGKYFVILASYILFPLAAIELFSQFKFSTGYIYKTFTAHQIPAITEKGFHAPNLRMTYKYKTIYPNLREIKNVRFNTDNFGTIEPSSLRSNKSRINDSILFCGGSTTESAAVEEGRRVPDVFSSISKIPSINAGKSSKNLEGCTKSIDFVLSNIGQPRKIIVANNVNAVTQFARIESAEETRQVIGMEIFMSTLPGLHKSFETAKINFNKIYAKKNKKPVDLLPYETGLQKGCCYGASRFNKSKDSPKFDWKNNQNLQRYHNFIVGQGQILRDMLARYDYPLTDVIIFMEPNSFLNDKTSALYDYRQFLSDRDGRLLNGSESAEIIQKYDREYQRALRDLRFQILEIDPEDLRDEHFYDAVHLSPAGSDFIGKFYAIHVK